MARSSVRKRPTQDDVARMAGVSQTVVSAVLNERAEIAIADETRRRVLEAIESLGYVPNGSARSLRTRKTKLIASLIPDISNPFYPAFERGIQDVVDGHGYDLTAYNTDGLREKELRCLQSVLRARADGVIATPFQITAEDFSPLIESGMPVVVFGEMTSDTVRHQIDEIYVNDLVAASKLITYLIEKNSLPLVMLGGQLDVLRREGRITAYQQIMNERGLLREDSLVRGEDPTEAGGYAAMRQFLSRPSLPRAVFACNDMMAMGAMVAIREAGLRVPEDIAVAGFDDITVARLLNPPLTTVAQFPERLGRRAAEMLFERIAGSVSGEGRRVEMPHQLMIRDSA